MVPMSELSETEILTSYGDLLWESVSAFGQDARYAVDMVDSANLIAYKRALWEARSQAVKVAQTPDAVRPLTLKIMAEKGIEPPRKRNSRT